MLTSFFASASEVTALYGGNRSMQICVLLFLLLFVILLIVLGFKELKVAYSLKSKARLDEQLEVRLTVG